MNKNMEIENQNQQEHCAMHEKAPGPGARIYILAGAILASSIVLALGGVYVFDSRRDAAGQSTAAGQVQPSALEERVIPSAGVVLPVVWGDLGARLVDAGAIDVDTFKGIYQQRGSFTEEYSDLLLGQNNGQLKITNENSGYLLNLLWALGLASKNPILETGEMMDPRYGGAGVFASTGGWTVSQGDSMNHYSKHVFFDLTPEQQILVDKVSRGIYRPCCGNATHFPDCNHGMAMLGLLELMASQGVSEREMWETALTVNSYWFPNNYLTIASYLEGEGTDWQDVSPQEALGSAYSSSQGFARIAAQVNQVQSQQGGSGCGIEAAPAVSQQRQQGGCGI